MEALLSQLTNIMYFLIVLGLAVIFHEWGHFIVAKLLGAKVDRFAVGFGQKLFSYTWHDTEYAVCALPLGGYVKIRGMDPDDETTGAEWEFLQLSPWKRILIVVAGPLMNFVLAYLIYVIIFAGFGEAYTASTVVGRVPVNSGGWEMGLLDGDRIVSVNGQPVESWNDITQQLGGFIEENRETSGDRTLALQVERDGQILEKSKAIPEAIFQSQNNSLTIPETFQGIFVTDVLKGGVAEKAGIKPGMTIESADGQILTTRDEWSSYFSSRFQKDDKGQYLTLPVTVVARETNGATIALTLQPELVQPAPDAVPNQPKTKIDLLYEGEMSIKEYLTPSIGLLGVAPKLSPVVGSVREGGPASKAGIATGSRIVEINGEPVDDWVDLLLAEQNAIQNVEVPPDTVPPASPVEITWLDPSNQMKTATVTPTVEMQNILTHTSMKTGKRYAMVQLGMDMQSDRRTMGIIGALGAAWNRLLYISGTMVDFIGQLITGQASPKLLGGPIAIYQLSAETGRWGMERFLGFIALLSANLGLLNLFPLPPLDGGHVVFYIYEMLRRKPISMAQMENFGRIGFALIIPLMLFLIFNDLSRLDFFSWIRGLFS